MADMDIGDWFGRCGWSCQEVEAGIWHSQFAAGDDEDYDLFVTQSGDFVHFAISPFVPKPTGECRARTYRNLLRLNQQMSLAYFAVDDDGDVNLMLDLPIACCAYEIFVLALETLRGYTQTLARDVYMLGQLPGYQSRLLGRPE